MINWLKSRRLLIAALEQAQQQVASLTVNLMRIATRLEKDLQRERDIHVTCMNARDEWRERANYYEEALTDIAMPNERAEKWSARRANLALDRYRPQPMPRKQA